MWRTQLKSFYDFSPMLINSGKRSTHTYCCRYSISHALFNKWQLANRLSKSLSLEKGYLPTQVDLLGIPLYCQLMPPTTVSPKSSSKVERMGAPNFWLYAQCGWDRAAQWRRWMKIQHAMYEMTPASPVWRRWMKHTSKNKACPFVLPY